VSFVDMQTLTWPEAAELAETSAVGLIPTGAMEQHGPHLPLITDTIIARHLAEEIAERISEPVIVTPVVAVGLSSHHTGFPGTATLTDEVFAGQLRALMDAFARMKVTNVALFSAHGGNFACLGRVAEAVEREPGREGMRVRAYADFVAYLDVMFAAARGHFAEPLPESDVHAGAMETSQLLHLAPALVRPFSDVQGYTEASHGWLERLFGEGTKALSETGVLGRPPGASAEAGRAICDALASELATWMSREFPSVTLVEPLGPGTVRDRRRGWIAS
jgi:creatinine amidohydrolase